MALYVSDTNALISYFSEVFEQEPVVSSKALSLIGSALSTSESEYKLSVPSVVFIEIYEKWCDEGERLAKIYWNVFRVLAESPNVEIKPIEREVLENLMQINLRHEMHDKIILASAMMLDCPLITSDLTIIDYVEKNKVIPAIIK